MKYFLIGIKGSGMSALALMLNSKGHTVAGSDFDEYFFSEKKLKQEGIKIYSFDFDLLDSEWIYIIGNAFLESKMAVRIQEAGYINYSYSQFIAKSAVQQIAISGTHGKTTTAMIVKSILEKEVPIDYIVGDGTGGGAQDAQYFVYEACEYRNNFLAYNPKYLIVNNIEFDHPDFFLSLDEYRNSFRKLASQSQITIINGDTLVGIIPGITFGFNNTNDYVFKYSKDVLTVNDYSFDVPYLGKHMLYNFGAAIVLALILNYSVAKIQEGIDEFKLPKRRMNEYYCGETILVDDYAHHPTQIAATINYYKEKYPYKRIVVAFQPHTYTRTKALLKEFIKALSLADVLYIDDIFTSVREKESPSIAFLSSQIPGSLLLEGDVTRLVHYAGEVVILMGAGNIGNNCEFLENIFINQG